MNYQEINFDGLVGPTHNYAGLSLGNIASEAHRALPSNPKAAALQGLRKAKTLADWGFPQAILPPHERPDVMSLRKWGLHANDDAGVLARAAKEAPLLLAAASSASPMWTANACTMTPSCDTSDKRAHFTPANLSSNLHRAIEGPFTHRVLETIFDDSMNFAVHRPLAGGSVMADEGAANHTRLCLEHSSKGLHLFVYGRQALSKNASAPERFPARQSLESVEAIARIHHLPEQQVLFLQQCPKAIDAGVFHNDVISVGHRDVFLSHEQAFAGGQQDLEKIARTFMRNTGKQLHLVSVPEKRLSLAETVRTYLFNSQLLSLKGGGMILAVPGECLESGIVSELLSEWVEDKHNPIREIVSFSLKESMNNGGGPACLRQRVVLSDRELQHLRGRLFLDQELYGELVAWVEKHYRDSLEQGDLADPDLLQESRTALDELTGILRLPSIYPFQL